MAKPIITAGVMILGLYVIDYFMTGGELATELASKVSGAI